MGDLAGSLTAQDPSAIHVHEDVGPFKNLLSEFVYMRTYSRWVEEEGRRETWDETVARYMQFIAEERSIPAHLREEIHAAIRRMDVLPSMRALWSAGEAARRDNTALYNCSSAPLDSLRSFAELLHVLMCGTGAGFSVERRFVDQLPVVAESTEEVLTYQVADSTEGWADALYFGLTAWFSGQDVVFDTSGLRPRGAPLRVKGGRASGPEPLERLLTLCRETVRGAVGRRLLPIECHDIACAIGDIVHVGGFRRAALISFSDPDDEDLRHAKDWSKGNFPAIRYMANNSSYYNAKPTEEAFWKEWQALVASKSGERGFFHIPEWKKGLRAGADLRSNPCVSARTWVHTTEGPRQVCELIGKSFEAVVDGRVYPSTDAGFWYTGFKPLFRLETAEGYLLELTADHLVCRVVQSGAFQRCEWVAASELVSGDSVRLCDHRGAAPMRGSLWQGEGDVSLFEAISEVWEDQGPEDWGRMTFPWEGDHRDAQRQLLRFGVKSTVSQSPPGIEVAGDDLVRLASIVNVHYVIDGRDNTPDPFVARFTRLVPMGEDDVYDCSIPGLNAFDANGFYVHNCGEILLRYTPSDDPWTGAGGGGEFCNLSAAVMRADDTVATMAEKVRLATWIGVIQASFTHFPYLRPGWTEACEKDRLLGVDITGQCDNPKLSDDPAVMLYLNQVARLTAAEASAYMGINMPVAIACGKPSGNSSQLVDCASGFHPRYAAYYLRRVRVDGKDPLTALLRDAGVPLFKENGMEHLPDAEVPVWVVEFPVKAPEGAMLRDSETAVEMCERYLRIMRTWCSERGHNQSATIYVREHEWEELGRWVYAHFDEITGLSFLPYDSGKYKLAPYEEITQEEYLRAVARMPHLDFSLLSSYEHEDRGQGAQELACTSGSCEIDFDRTKVA